MAMIKSACIGLFALAAGGCVGTTTTPSTRLSANGCEVSDLAEVFTAPLKYDGKWFCGAVVFISDPIFGFYPQSPTSQEDRYGTVLLPKSSRSQAAELVRLGSGRLFVKGRLRVERRCVNKKAICTPISRPIDLEEFSFERPRN
jgi:hypothetical protein